MSSPIVDARVVCPGCGHGFRAADRDSVNLDLDAPDTLAATAERVPTTVPCPSSGVWVDVLPHGPPEPWSDRPPATRRRSESIVPDAVNTATPEKTARSATETPTPAAPADAPARPAEHGAKHAGHGARRAGCGARRAGRGARRAGCGA